MEINELINNLNFSNLFWQILTPLIFSCADIITGFIQAVINENVETSKMRKGLLHKVLILLVIILSFIIDMTFGLKFFVSKIVSMYVIFMEILSIVENITKAGINVGKLSDILKINWERGNNENGKDE